MRRAAVLALALLASPVAAQNAAPVVASQRALTLPLLAPDANTVAWMVWRDGAMVPLIGPTWTQNGTVPQVARTASTTAAAGPFSDANWYSITAGDPFDFAGDFTAIFVVSLDATGVVRVIFDDGAVAVGGGGWAVYFNTTGTAVLQTRNATGGSFNATTTNAAPVGVPSVICVGRSGTTQSIKLNLGTVASGTFTMAQDSTRPATLGRGIGGGIPANANKLYEVQAGPVAFSDAFCTAAAQRVKQRMGLSW